MLAPTATTMAHANLAKTVTAAPATVLTVRLQVAAMAFARRPMARTASLVPMTVRVSWVGNPADVIVVVTAQPSTESLATTSSARSEVRHAPTFLANPPAAETKSAKGARTASTARSTVVRRQIVVTDHAIQLRTYATALRIVEILSNPKLIIARMGLIMIATVGPMVLIRIAPATVV
jgi:hypothetical protein